MIENTTDPLWYKDAVIYQLHVKSFFDSTNDGVGDFAGLIAKLDYLVELGVNTVWLLPFYPSPRRDDGYDIADYRDVHPEYGKLKDVRRFIAAAHDKGLRVITELVINHTSDQHPWFQKARRSPKGSNARNFYVWADDDKGYSETRIIFCDTETSNWAWDDVAKAYYWHRFYSHQPDLNFDNPQVVKAVLSVMRFWLDMGIDGLRLDAVPYLVEREGTNNENLPETHEILKIIRAEMDRDYPGRMLLAEANQWPEDTQLYFGAGDECHMAFHFPLMPRMYMAIAREDRFPISDIMRQTPEIPENCQWAIFLRNHDELTLEMVTDSERDYLWEVYASEKRARINLGIRRRLAPLMERDRRRIELMNSLLLSMPGTPIIYYGDEIGMGDNIHLGDRDGVRTPMQWSPDRNGGFSRANPAQLVLPPIMDPLYGFEAINVEAQSRDPHSLLNWTRRMLAVRREHKAFGRGSLRFLYPGNRKVLAYLREFDGETIMCVANLSRSAEAVELDLSVFNGRVPVEMNAGSSFPPIGQLPYLLTLPPYGFYWFKLAVDARVPAWHTPAPDVLPEFSTLVLRGTLAKSLEAQAKTAIETEALPEYLARRRWFASKHKKISSISIEQMTPLQGNDDMVLSEVTTSGNDRYLLPLGIVWEETTTGALPHQLAIAQVRRRNKVGRLTDGLALEGFVRTLLAAFEGNVRLPSGNGEVLFDATDAHPTLKLAPEETFTWLPTDQSNSSVLIGDAAILKLFRRLNDGIHPEAEMSRYLTTHGFANTAKLYGEIKRVDTDGKITTYGLLQSFLRNQGDGWNWTLDYLRRTASDLSVGTGDQAACDDALKSYEALAQMAGLRLGQMHALLAQPTEDEAFAPRLSDHKDVDGWIAGIGTQVDAALDILDRQTEWASEEDQARAAEILKGRAALKGLVARYAKDAAGSMLTRTHGDFHLGQMLVSQGDVFIIDFEGEPSRPLEERRAKQSPYRDVAGMLRSFDYAACAAMKTEVGHDSPQGNEKRLALIETFRKHAVTAFLKGYREGAADIPHEWKNARSEEALLALFELEKAAYEVCYEAANRPAWLGIPLRGILALMTPALQEA